MSVALVKWSKADRDINVTAGLDEEQTRELFDELLREQRNSDLIQSANDYYLALGTDLAAGSFVFAGT